MNDEPAPDPQRPAKRAPHPAPPARAEPTARLRNDVRLLGDLVGEVLREQGGPELFEAVEHRAHGGHCAPLGGPGGPAPGAGAAGLGAARSRPAGCCNWCAPSASIST